ncbi:alpha beta-hydrolase [Coniophora puteana RWD-64-598 SS2]|uniref:Carboxylic ester hydrolase n=1 Tax=Coniophora puteana (strain RWD-64-598) TaxID=741705 RepID=A0A5M3MQM9_CONPW|nr:alpha beta-hydrolase [Coniophora puteana RWD-64-598 SS2]EIW81508.1 alpha beta-hydrolase [Coniophora puteana RWD-64-598 SS2]
MLVLEASLAAATPTPVVKRASPTVQLDDATVTGVAGLTTNSWLGIPFAQPPVGSLRFQLPQSLTSYNASFSATAYGPACPQQAISIPLPSVLPADAVTAIDNLTNWLYGVVTPSSEDCLTINVVAPADATPDSNLPVIAWIFGGGFELGSPSTYPGSVIVDKAIELDVPAIYVSMNYRVTAFGFLASKEVQDAGVGNLGLQDQRLALKWIQQYISNFGGDPTKVTIWGESAGAISVALQMLTNGGNTEGLFRAGFMQSGSPIPVGDITLGQQYYDFLVDQTGCASSDDTLECLRGVEYETLMDAINQTPNIFSYQSLILAWLPRVDGVFLTDDPQQLVLQGSVADVPFITGDCDDEGTLFSLSGLNITDDSDLYTWLKTYWLPNATESQIDAGMALYSTDPADGSPFNTSDLYALTPEFKRIAAFQGDSVFQGPRRFFLEHQSSKQSTWSFLSKRFKWVPVLGSFHGSDILNVYLGGDMADYLVRFAANLDPNGDTGIEWPQYTTDSPNMLTFLDGLIPLEITQDTYRAAAMEGITNLTLEYPI